MFFELNEWQVDSGSDQRRRAVKFAGEKRLQKVTKVTKAEVPLAFLIGGRSSRDAHLYQGLDGALPSTKNVPCTPI